MGYFPIDDLLKSGVFLKHAVLIFFALLPCTHAMAEATTIVRVVDEEKRFIPLKKSTSTSELQNGVKVTHENASAASHSDREQMRAGFMRIDRTASTVVPKTQEVKPKSAAALASPMLAVKPEAPAPEAAPETPTYERESDEIEGLNETNNPVLILYGGSEKSSASSFAEAMRGLGVGGLARHWLWPVDLKARQYVSSLYGVRKDPFHGRPTFHGGIDIAADVGTPVLAAADGEVTQVTSDAGYGRYITLQHADGTLTRYGHLSAQMVRASQQVKAGEAIGAVGSTGRSTGPHLDFRVSKNNVRYDPLSFLSVPSSVAMKASPSTGVASAARPAVSVVRGSSVASNPLPKRPMVIQVR